MERRNFMKLAVGAAVGVAALTAVAHAAPLAPQSLNGSSGANADIRPAVTSSEEIAQLKPEQVHWHGGWHHRHWGWHHRHWGWRHRHWGWHHRWHRHHWRRW